MTLTSPIRIRDSISIQLLKLVFSFYFIVTIVITLVHMGAEFWDTREAVKQEISVIGNTFAPGLARALWDMNPKQLQPTFLGMVQFPAIEGVRLENEKGEEVGASGLIMAPEGHVFRIESNSSKLAVEGYTGLFHYSFPVFFERRGKRIKVGPSHDLFEYQCCVGESQVRLSVYYCEFSHQNCHIMGIVFMDFLYETEPTFGRSDGGN